MPKLDSSQSTDEPSAEYIYSISSDDGIRSCRTNEALYKLRNQRMTRFIDLLNERSAPVKVSLVEVKDALSAVLRMNMQSTWFDHEYTASWILMDYNNSKFEPWRRILIELDQIEDEIDPEVAPNLYRYLASTINKISDTIKSWKDGRGERYLLRELNSKELAYRNAFQILFGYRYRRSSKVDIEF